MLDVHTPEHRIGGVRDFLLHIFTITVGLLIALALENTVEALHHRHQRSEAEAAIRNELNANQSKLKDILKSSVGTRNNMIRALGFLEDRRGGRVSDPSGIQLGFSEGPLQSTAWKTAVATGTLNYMEPAQVQRFAGAYAEQQLFEEAEARALEHVERLDSYTLGRAPDPAHLDPQDILAAIPEVHNVLADLSAMQDLGRGTLGTYDEALRQ